MERGWKDATPRRGIGWNDDEAVMLIHNKVVCGFLLICFTPAACLPAYWQAASYYPRPSFAFLSFSSDEGGFHIPLVGILWAN
jgi:hypothetical protein